MADKKEPPWGWGPQVGQPSPQAPKAMHWGPPPPVPEGQLPPAAVAGRRKPRGSTLALAGKLTIKDGPAYWAQSGLEDGEQKALFAWAAMHAHKEPRLKLMFAIPNGGQRTGKFGGAAAGAKLAATGVKSGVPDIFLPVTIANEYELEELGLFIELKKVKGGVLSDAQEQWGKDLMAQGYLWYRCDGWIAARDVIVSYLGLNPEQFQ